MLVLGIPPMPEPDGLLFWGRPTWSKGTFLLPLKKQNQDKKACSM
jgi:hypothetical protein